MKRPPGLPLFLQTLGLVIVTLVAAQTTAILVIFSLPPPPTEVYTVDDVAQEVRLAADVNHDPTESRLTARLQSAPPATMTNGWRRLMFRDALARNLGVPPTSIVIDQHGPRIVAYGGRPRREVRLPPESNRLEPLLFGRFAAAVRQSDGRWLVVEPKATFGIDPWQSRLLLVFGLAGVAVSPLAWAYSHRLAAPIAAFAAAAERLGRDPGAPPLDINGSSEIAAAAEAFNQMQQRLRRYVEDRTSMMAAIAHDLRTPLTRLRFRIDAVPDNLRGGLEDDLDQMEAMLSSTLAFVRDAVAPRERRPLELASLVETVMDEAALTGAQASVERADRVVVEGDPLALKRLVANLVDNALKYGARARARVFTDDGMAIIEIDDDGPGMPDGEIERVFEPFHRIETSRNRETGGIGLGLAVVRAVARSHGGDVILRNRRAGGLSARVALPLAPKPAHGRSG
jgi:two-component system, OmpR family, sensor kinase